MDSFERLPSFLKPYTFSFSSRANVRVQQLPLRCSEPYSPFSPRRRGPLPLSPPRAQSIDTKCQWGRGGGGSTAGVRRGGPTLTVHCLPLGSDGGAQTLSSSGGISGRVGVSCRGLVLHMRTVVLPTWRHRVMNMQEMQPARSPELWPTSDESGIPSTLQFVLMMWSRNAFGLPAAYGWRNRLWHSCCHERR